MNKGENFLSNEVVRSISLYGEVVDDKNEWLNWYKQAKSIINLLGYEANYFSIEGGGMKSGKVMRINRSEKKLLESVGNLNGIKWMSIYSLPKDYKSASFDYDVLLVRNIEYVTLIASKSDFKEINEDALIDLLKEHVNVKSGEIYEMERDECPLLYVSRVNSLSSFKTLKIMKTV